MRERWDGLEADLARGEGQDRVLTSLADGLITTWQLSEAFSTRPSLCCAFVEALASSTQGFWPAFDEAFAHLRPASPELRKRLQAVVSEAAKQKGRDLDPIFAGLSPLSISRFDLVLGAEIELFLSLAAPSTRAAALVFSSLQRPWEPIRSLSIDLSKSHQKLSRPSGLRDGPYEAWIEDRALGLIGGDEQGQERLIEVQAKGAADSSGAAANAGAALSEAWREFSEASLRTARRKIFQQAQASEAGCGMVLDFLRRSESAPRASKLMQFRALAADALRHGALAGALLRWAGADRERLVFLRRQALPSWSAAAPLELESGALPLWRELLPERAALLALSSPAAPIDALRDFGELTELWRDGVGQTRRISVHLLGKDYSILVQSREGGVIKGMMTAADDEEIEVIIEPAGEADEEKKRKGRGDGGQRLYPELARRILLLSDDGLVTEARRALPVNRQNPVYVELKVPKTRPRAEDVGAFMGDGRELALKASRRNLREGDRDDVEAAGGFAGGALESEAYSRAMLEWALVLPEADEAWKQRLWAIDRESKSLLQAGAKAQERGLEKANRGAAQLASELVRSMALGRANPAPLALEKALIQLALMLRAFARHPETAQDGELRLEVARLEGLSASVGARLLGTYCVLIELILQDGVESRSA